MLDEAVNETDRREGFPAPGGHLDQGAGAVLGKRLLQVADGLDLGRPEPLLDDRGHVAEPLAEGRGEFPQPPGQRRGAVEMEDPPAPRLGVVEIAPTGVIYTEPHMN